MNLKQSLISSVLALTLTGCISEFDAKLPLNESHILVVSGTVIENTDVTFHLSKGFPLDSVKTPKGSRDIDAKLTIIGSNGYQSQQAINMGNGEYLISAGALNDDVEYGIEIEYDGNIYRSTLSKPLRTPEIDSISFVQPEENGDIIFYISTHDDAEETKYFLWNYTEDWEFTAIYETTVFFDPEKEDYYIDRSAPFYHCWRNKVDAAGKYLIGSTEFLGENRIINRELYKASSGDERFSVLYCVTVYQKAISKEAYEYYQNRIKLNQEMGGLFTPQPSEVQGNISCITDPAKRVMGYVEVIKNTTQERLFICNGQITRQPAERSCGSRDVETKDLDKFYVMEGTYAYTSLAALYNAGMRPSGYLLLSEKGNYYPSGGWRHKSCSDCTAAGGTKNKPEFWKQCPE